MRSLKIKAVSVWGENDGNVVTVLDCMWRGLNGSKSTNWAMIMRGNDGGKWMEDSITGHENG